jgi:hypothetical protein
MNDGKDWSNINLAFQREWGDEYKKRWIKAGFNYSQTQDWINIGITPDGDNAFFCAWLRDEVGMTPSRSLKWQEFRRIKRRI